VVARLPSRRQVLPVFSVILFVVFSWTLYQMFRQVPSWLYYLNIFNILTISAYVLSFALLESLFMLGLVLVLSLVFPARIFRDQFVSQASAQVLWMSAGALVLQSKIDILPKVDTGILMAAPLVVLACIAVSIILFSWIFARLGFLSRWLGVIAERMVVFSYIYVPLGLVSLVVVILRNLF
jgi:hypothetical protein